MPSLKTLSMAAWSTAAIGVALWVWGYFAPYVQDNFMLALYAGFGCAAICALIAAIGISTHGRKALWLLALIFPAGMMPLFNVLFELYCLATRCWV